MSSEPTFSQRKGIKPIKKEIQLNGIDKELRVALWNSLTKYYWHNTLNKHWISEYEPNVLTFIENLWSDFLKRTLDNLRKGGHWPTILDVIKKEFFSSPWYWVYDFIEYVAKNYPNTKLNSEFTTCCNTSLEKEFSGYRFIGTQIAEITSDQEIVEIKQAMNSPLQSVNEHLSRALSLLSDRENPDPRNSIKESISAVESICQKITGNDSATLGDALNVIRDKKQIELPQSLRDAFNKIYGYTSSKDGIRHALSEESTLSHDDARFMLISCSAFVNYLISKSLKAGIQLK